MNEVLNRLYDDIFEEYQIKKQEVIIKDILDIYNGKYKTYKDYQKHVEEINQLCEEQNQDIRFYDYALKISLAVSTVVLCQRLFNYIKREAHFNGKSN